MYFKDTHAVLEMGCVQRQLKYWDFSGLQINDN